MGRVAGVLWLVAAFTVGVGQLLPGSAHADPWLFAGIEAFVVAYAIACLTGTVRWEVHSMRTHAVVTAALMPLIGVALWSTGGVDSAAQPLMVLPLLYIAYFFPGWQGAALLIGLIAVYAAPLAYDSHPTGNAFPGSSLNFAVAAIALTAGTRILKGRLVVAERRQREMARTDALTALVNRRGFDLALTAALDASGDAALGRREVDDERGCALVVFDLDDFKAVNDRRGHAAGDDLLRAVAAHCRAVTRPGDTLARIGGDEFALVAPGAGAAGAERLAAALDEAVGAAGARATLGWALHGPDGVDADSMLRAADRRLYEGKAADPLPRRTELRRAALA